MRAHDAAVRSVAAGSPSGCVVVEIDERDQLAQRQEPAVVVAAREPDPEIANHTAA